jgi:ADP-ribose pyrophosphatase
MKLKKYFALLKEYPELFENHDSPLKIIQDLDAIRAWQKEYRKKLKESDSPNEWADIGVIVDDPYFILLRDLVQFPSGHRNGYVRMIPRSELFGAFGVIVLPIYLDKIILLNHFRHSTRQWHLEIPRGYGEPYISSIESARRELKEEISGEISKLVSLGTCYPETGFECQRAELFLAELNSIGGPAINEGIEDYGLVSITKFEAMIRDGEITDGFTIVAYTRAKLRGLI